MTDAAWSDYSDQFRKEVLPKILNSAAFVSIGTEIGVFDVRQATEIGAALIYDKPILLIIPPGRTISQHLRRAADIVIDDWDSSNADKVLEIHQALTTLQIQFDAQKDEESG